MRILHFLGLSLVMACTMVQAAEEPRPAAALLPLQDRAGETEIALQINEVLGQSLEEVAVMVDPVQVRDTMRRLRIRSAMDVRPARLETLFQELEAQWIVVPILHSINISPVPRVTLSALVLHAGSREVTWAGFRSVSGLDNRRILGRGVQIQIQDVATRAARELIRDFVRESLLGAPGGSHLTRRSDKGGYLRQPLSPEKLGLVAIVPFDALTGSQAAFQAGVLTAIAYAELYRHGIRLALPALVSETLRRRHNLTPGELDQASRIALLIAGDIDTVFTGTVEQYDLHGGTEPEPLVSCSARLIGAEDGRILWYHGMEESGWDHEKIFLTGRTYTRGHLAEELIHAMLSGALRHSSHAKSQEGPTT